MPSVTLRAHYDGERIQLDEPFDLPTDSRLLVTVLSQDADSDRASWAGAAAEALRRAYGDDEPEYALEETRR